MLASDRSFLMSAILSCLCATMCTSQSTTYYVTPNVSTVPCPQKPCHEFQTYYQNQSFYFQSYTQFIFLPGEHKFDLGGLLLVQDKQNISLVGSPNLTVHTVAEKVQEYEFDSHEEDWSITYLESSTKIICSNLSGFVFANVSNLVLSNFSVVSCGQNSSLTSFNASIHLYNVENLLMDGISVQNSTGYGMIGVNVLGSYIARSSFIGNNQYVKDMFQKIAFSGFLCNGESETLYVNDGSIPCESVLGGNVLLQYSEMNKSSHLQLTDLLFALGLDGTFINMPNIPCIAYGTGLSVTTDYVELYVLSADIENAMFYRNQAYLGANLNLNINMKYAISLKNIHNMWGIAMAGGAGVCASIAGISGLFQIADSVFECNHVYPSMWGLGSSMDISYAVSRNIGGTSVAELTNCVFKDNAEFRIISLAQLPASFQANLSINGSIIENSDASFIFMKVSVSGSNFTRSSWAMLNSAVTLSGVVAFSNCSEDSNGGAMSLISTILTMEPWSQVAFVNNSAQFGGAIFVDSSSHIAFESPCNVSFINNKALVSGGGIYVQTASQALSPACFFTAVNASMDEKLNIQLYFSDNLVGEAGSVLYGGNIDNCVMDCSTLLNKKCNGSGVFSNISIDGGGNEYPLISSDPTSVCPCSGPCSSTLMNFTVYPGQSVNVAFIAIGQQNTIAPSVVILYTKSPLTTIISALRTDKDCTNYSIPFELINQTLYISTQEALLQNIPTANTFEIAITVLIPCPRCFKQVSSSCQCNDLLSENGFICHINDQTANVSGNQWVGNTVEGQLAIFEQCPFDYCSHDGNINLTDFSSRCNHHRSGVLCGQCLPGLSTTFGTSQCKSCSNYNLFLIIPFAIMGLVLVVCLFALNLTVSAGTLYGIIFYANIFRINDNIFFPGDQRSLFVQFLSASIAWLNLDFGIEACFYDSMDSYAKTWLQFVFPTYIFSLVGIIVIAGKYSSLISRLCRFNAVPVLATLILLSYSKILRTTITIFSSAALTTEVNSTEVVWLYDGSIHFLEPKHAILFVFGLLVVIFFVIPYTILLLLAPCLQARSHWRCLHWVNRIKPLIDSYQAPFKDKYRFWSGILLLSRLPLYLFLALVNEPSFKMWGIMIFTYLYITILFVLSVYKSWHLLLLEVVFIGNMTATMALTLLSQKSGLVFSIVGAVVFLIVVSGVIVYHAFRQIKTILKFWFMMKQQPTTNAAPVLDHHTPEASNKGTRSSSGYGSIYEGYREPLLTSV